MSAIWFNRFQRFVSICYSMVLILTHGDTLWLLQARHDCGPISITELLFEILQEMMSGCLALGESKSA